MLEEKNDNLPEADGNQNSEIIETKNSENQETIPDSSTTENTDLTINTTENLVLTEEVSDEEAHKVIETSVLKEAEQGVHEVESKTENVIELTENQLNDTDIIIETNNESVVQAIDDANAEESEDETLKDRHEIPLLDYESLPMEKLVEELENLVSVTRVMSIKDHVEELKKAFLSKYHHLIDEKRQEFLAENPETTEEFEYHLPLKSKFDKLYNEFKDKKNNHFKSLENTLKSNLANRLSIVEELKNLVHSQENISATLKKFNDLRDRWKVAGPIPKDKYNHVWNNYHFHLENFYDILHLDREIRDMDFKNNLEQKQKIIDRVEELLQEEDIAKAFRELQDLHRIWKEDIGPVSREHRDEIWNRFSELTRQMHDKRESLFEKLREVETQNLVRKREIIAAIEELAQQKMSSHAAWLGQIEKVEQLRNNFFSTGRVPAEVNEQTWAEFKTAVRNFNALKNSFYKEIKKDQTDNLSRKQALIDKANELKDSDDFATTTPLMKQIQEEWKTIGHVPKKLSDKLWAEFRAACNHYFDRMKQQRSELNSEEVEAFEKKKAFLENLKNFELTGDHKTDLDAIKAYIESWKSIGKVPFSRRHIEGKFNKILDVLFEKLSSSKKENEMARYASKLDSLANSDTRRLDNEKVFIMRKIEEVQSEIFQLENNIQFFANAKADNPLVKEVKKNIERHKEELQTWKEKLKQLRNLNAE